MKRFFDNVLTFIYVLLMTAAVNCFLLGKSQDLPVFLPVLLFLILNILPFFSFQNFPGKRIRICSHGVRCLEIFCASIILSIPLNILLFIDKKSMWLNILFAALMEAVLFFNGIISVYLTSLQLGVKTRVLGAVFGLVPIVNLFFLWKIISTVSYEVKLETDKNNLNIKRENSKLCETKYPILLVHGVFFRDSEYFNYWGRIPKELIRNGATIYYGEHQSAASVADSAAELSERIRKIVNETGCEKLNIIAHSKGGLDCRYAIEHFGIGQYVASLTTVNTPHRGCKFADYLLTKIPAPVQAKVADAYNSTLKRLGDTNPDFMAAVRDLTSEKGEAFDASTPMPVGIYCQSIGSKLNHASGGKFPLNFSYRLVSYFDGANDGLVGEQSFKWGENYTYLTVSGKRGISHGDVIDLNRENIREFDVREWYVQLVMNLKLRGL